MNGWTAAQTISTRHPASGCLRERMTENVVLESERIAAGRPGRQSHDEEATMLAKDQSESDRSADTILAFNFLRNLANLAKWSLEDRECPRT